MGEESLDEVIRSRNCSRQFSTDMDNALHEALKKRDANYSGLFKLIESDEKRTIEQLIKLAQGGPLSGKLYIGNPKVKELWNNIIQHYSGEREKIDYILGEISIPSGGSLQNTSVGIAIFIGVLAYGGHPEGLKWGRRLERRFTEKNMQKYKELFHLD